MVLTLVLAPILLAALAAALLLARSLVSSRPSGLTIRNFRGVEIPVVGGVVVVASILAAELVLAAIRLLGNGVIAPGVVPPSALLASTANAGLLLLAVGFFALGGADDLLGRPNPAGAPGLPQSKGFRGHAQALSQGIVTGGVLKAAGGGVLGLIAGALWESHPAAALLDGLLVALGANLLNLLDLRPGRAAKAFLICAAALFAAGVGAGSLPVLAATAVAVLVWLPLDLGERGMLGDAGANLLGGVLGGAAALELAMPAKLATAFVLVVLTAASERWSFTAAIDRVPPLRWADRLGRLPS
jgi:UDP-GlcNAc:undecaprenyl-phosphate GlcNAc-1-phosphate transferase